MNEELKIIIKAVTSDAKKQIGGIKKELGGISGSAKSASSGFGKAMKGFGVAAGIAIGAITAIGAALVALGKKTLDYQKVQAKLNTAFLSMGSTAKQAQESYNGLFRFLGDQDTSVEAAAHLAKLTTNQKELAEWTKICQGVYATFGDSLKIESLTEAANETARVGKVTGTMADALNWAGVSEDAFNEKLAATSSFEEREAMIRETLNGLYKDAAEIYEQNNKALLEHNESQARLDASMAAAGAAITPLLTALNNLSATLFDVLKPAIDAIVPVLVTFVDWITKGLQAVMGLFGVINGGSSTVNTFADMGASVGSAATGANNLTSGLEDAAKAAEKAKRATMGFDELNVVGGNSSGSSSSGSSNPAYTTGMTPTVDASKFTVEVEETSKKGNGFLDTMKKIGTELKEVFNPAITAWAGAFDTIKQGFENSKEHFVAGGKSIIESFKAIGTYVFTDFVPNMVNSFSVNLAPVIGDVFAAVLEEGSKTFETLADITNRTTQNIMIPALDTLKKVYMDIFETIGGVWEQKGKPFLEQWAALMENVRKILDGLYTNFIEPISQKVIAVVNDVWDNCLKGVYEKIVDAVIEIGTCIMQLYNEFLAPIVNWIITYIVPVIAEAVNVLIEHVGNLLKAVGKVIGGIIDVIKGLVQFIVGVFTGDWEKAWEGVKNILSGIWDAIVGIFEFAWHAITDVFNPEVVGEFWSSVWGVIKNIFSGVGNWFKNIFVGAWNGVKSAWGSVTSFFSGVWSNIKGVFGSVGDWFKNTFTKAWTNVKNVFSTGGKIFTGIKDGILSGLKTIINGIIGGINKVIKVPFDGLNTALKKIKSINILGVKPFSWLGTISVPQIPKLAKGGIIDKATLAMIGERGKEAVLPLENNTGWMDKLVEKLASYTSGPTKIVLELDGKELGWANINSINNITRQTGRLQLSLA